jgi:hypothetical protein
MSTEQPTSARNGAETPLFEGESDGSRGRVLHTPEPHGRAVPTPLTSQIREVASSQTTAKMAQVVQHNL